MYLVTNKGTAHHCCTTADPSTSPNAPNAPQSMYLVLVTNKGSNMDLDLDLETLRLCGKVVPQTGPGQTHGSIHGAAADT